MNSKSTVTNSIANMTSKVWSLVSIYIFVPLYISYLGEEAYGLVSFFATMQTALNLLGLGLSSTLRREFAMEIDGGYNVKLKKYKLMRNVELLYFAIALIIILICVFGSSNIAVNWFDSSILGTKIVSSTVTLMGISIALQLVQQIYFGALLGLGHQVCANVLNIAYSAIKAVGSVIVIALIISDVRLFYFWHILVDVVYLLVLRIVLIGSIKEKKRFEWHLKDIFMLKEIWRYSAGLIVISIIAFANKNVDRIIVSSFLTLGELGAYNSCYTLGQIVTMISTSVATAIFSNFTNGFSLRESKGKMQQMFTENYKIVVLIVGAIGAFVAIYGETLLYIWTRSESYVAVMSGSAKYIILGTMFLAFQEIPYAFLLAHGDTSINTKMGIAFFAPYICLLYFTVKEFGVFGGAVSYFVLMLLQTVIYVIHVYKKYFRDHVLKWFLKDTVLPIVFAVCVAICSKYVVNMMEVSPLVEVVFAVCSGGVTLAIMIVLFERQKVRKIFKCNREG